MRRRLAIRVVADDSEGVTLPLPLLQPPERGVERRRRRRRLPPPGGPTRNTGPTVNVRAREAVEMLIVCLYHT